MKFYVHGLKVAEGGGGLAPTILKVQRRAQRWCTVLTDARRLGRNGKLPKPKACITITSVLCLTTYTPATKMPNLASLSQLAIHHVTNMLNPSKKNGSVCQSVLQGMETNVRSPRLESKTTTIAIPPGMRYPPELNLVLIIRRSSKDAPLEEGVRRVARRLLCTKGYPSAKQSMA